MWLLLMIALPVDSAPVCSEARIWALRPAALRFPCCEKDEARGVAAA
jgi:hypothetical protein